MPVLYGFSLQGMRKHLFIPHRTLTTDQRNDSTQVHPSAWGSLLVLLTGAWTIQRQLNHQKVHPSTVHENRIPEVSCRTVTVSRTLEKDLVTLVTFRTYIVLVSSVHSWTRKCHSRRGCFNSEEPATDFESLAVPGKPGAGN